MSDEAFHLTALDVRRYDFGRALRGYEPARVDEFRDQVAEELERLARVNQDLDQKARSFHEQLRAFRERDKALNEALVTAQQMRQEVRDQADREAQLIIREAQLESERVLETAQSEIRRLQGDIETLERVRRSCMGQIRAMLTRQLAEIESFDRPLIEYVEETTG